MSLTLWIALLKSLWETVYMVAVSGGIATLLGMPLGLLLIATRSGGVSERPALNRLLAAGCNGLRSLPFIILLIALVPITRLMIGTSIGTTAAIVPLTIGAIPFIARIVENAIEEVPLGLVETGLAMGAKPSQIIFKILLPEAMPNVINGLTVTLIALVGYSAMAGAVGGGGLGDLAIRYGYQRFEVNVMIATIVVLIILVQLIQTFGDVLAKRLRH